MTDFTQDTSVSRRRKSSEIKISVETHYVGCTKRESNKIVKLRTTNKNFSQIPLKLLKRSRGIKSVTYVITSHKYFLQEI